MLVASPDMILSNFRKKKKNLIRLRRGTGWTASLLQATPLTKDRFSRAEAKRCYETEQVSMVA